MINPRLHLLTEVGNVEVWRVDGRMIRDKLDIEFTVAEHHYSSPYVPEREIWIDRESVDTEEWRAWGARADRERSIARSGAPLEVASRFGQMLEEAIRKDWRKAIDFAALVGQVNDALREMSHRGGELHIERVPGKVVRDWFTPEFVHGGHWRVYGFIPEGMIWIDDILSEDEQELTIVHEMHELRLMLKGASYEKAHPQASAAELKLRRAGSSLDGSRSSVQRF